jgi:hypothetical protein
MKELKWNDRALNNTCHKPSLVTKVCVVEGCYQYNIDCATDFWPEGGWYIGFSLCPKHAEMLKEAQWRYRNQMGGNSVPSP